MPTDSTKGPRRYAPIDKGHHADLHVQCSECLRMYPADKCLADLNAPAFTYHCEGCRNADR